MRRTLVTTLALVLLIAACSAPAGSPEADPSTPVPSPGATSQPSPESPSPEPSASPSVARGDPPMDPIPIPVNTYARVSTNDLRVRSKPGVSDDSKRLEPLLQSGTAVLVVDGPVQASGYDWYQVQPLVRSELQETIDPFGWVAAAGKDGEPWIEPADVDCPPAPDDYDGLSDLSPLGENYFSITCFSGLEFTFTGRLLTPEISCGTEPGWGVDPPWFDNCGAPATELVNVRGHAGLGVAWLPEIDLSIAPRADDPIDRWPIVEVTGMFDHPSAQSCTNRQNLPEAGPIEPDPALTKLNCRIRFVVTSLREIED